MLSPDNAEKTKFENERARLGWLIECLSAAYHKGLELAITKSRTRLDLMLNDDGGHNAVPRDIGSYCYK